MRRAALLVALATAACAPQRVHLRESCEVLRATLYRDGRFQLAESEIKALREVNQVKIDAVKRYYRGNCAKSPLAE